MSSIAALLLSLASDIFFILEIAFIILNGLWISTLNFNDHDLLMVLIFIRLFALTFDSKEWNLDIIKYLDGLISWRKVIAKFSFKITFEFILICNCLSFDQSVLIYTNNDFPSFLASMEDCNRFKDFFSRLLRLI